MSSQTSRQVSAGDAGGSAGHGTGRDKPMTGLPARLVFSWAFVGIPLAYGVFETAKKAAALFAG